MWRAIPIICINGQCNNCQCWYDANYISRAIHQKCPLYDFGFKVVLYLSCGCPITLANQKAILQLNWLLWCGLFPTSLSGILSRSSPSMLLKTKALLFKRSTFDWCYFHGSCGIWNGCRSVIDENLTKIQNLENKIHAANQFEFTFFFLSLLWTFLVSGCLPHFKSLQM